jgi:hypothetical protein
MQEATESGWYDLVSKGFIEYVDTEEEETTMISMTIAVCLVYKWLSSCNNDLPKLLATLVHVDSINETVERGKVGGRQRHSGYYVCTSGLEMLCSIE